MALYAMGKITVEASSPEEAEKFAKEMQKPLKIKSIEVVYECGFCGEDDFHCTCDEY